MPTITDYLVLQDVVLISSPEEMFFDFDLPDDYVAGTNFAKPIFSFIVKPSSSGAEIYIYSQSKSDPQATNQLVGQYVWGKGPHHDHALWEPMDGAKLKPGPNRIYIHVGEGRISLKKAMLWFQRNVSAC